MTTKAAELPVENADIDRTTPQPHIHVEERRLALPDYLKTLVKVNGSSGRNSTDSVSIRMRAAVRAGLSGIAA